MQKDQVKESFSLLEERLERLESAASRNETATIQDKLENFDFAQLSWIKEIRAQVQELHEVVEETVLKQKNIHARDLLNRICKFLIDEAQSQNQELCIACFGSGYISLNMVEAAMAAIISATKVSLKSIRSMDSNDRRREHLFYPSSINLELQSGDAGIYFSIADDGSGLDIKNKKEQFSALREYVAKQGGWFHASAFKNYGAKIEFKIPVQKIRMDSYLLYSNSFCVGIPSSCVTKVYDNQSMMREDFSSEYIYILDQNHGFVSVAAREVSKSSFRYAVLLGVADFQFLVACEKVEMSVPTRKVADQDFLEAESWFQYFGVYSKNGSNIIVPYLDGGAMMDFYRRERINK